MDLEYEYLLWQTKMNAVEKNKTTAKMQKKNQKANKKLQQQQQQQQQKQQNVTNNKNVRSKSTTATTQGSITSSTPASSSSTTSSYGVNKLTGKTTKYTNKNNNNNNNTQYLNHNENPTEYNNNNISEQTAAVPDAAAYTSPYKFERSNSFSLKGKLSKLINTITGSKENLNKISNEEESPYKFSRSRSMILLRRPNRRSFIEPQLEQLSEEAEKCSDTISPTITRKNSIVNVSDVLATINAQPENVVEKVEMREESQVLNTKSRHSLTPNSTLMEKTQQLNRKGSTTSLYLPDNLDKPFNPQLNFQKRRSNTLIASFKSTISSLKPEKRKEKLNPNWSASLQSLQAIDNMVSYANMSFIDYDKLNNYETQLERQLSTLSLAETKQKPILQNDCDSVDASSNIMTTPLSSRTVSQMPTHSSSATIPPTQPPLSILARQISSSDVVVRRRPRSVSASQKRLEHTSSRGSFIFDISNYEDSMDKERNVYRDSLDSRKLKLLNMFSRQSFVFDKHIIDILNLEDGTMLKRKCNVVVDGEQKLKSKSLTNLDGLDTATTTTHQSAIPTDQTNSIPSGAEYFSVSFCNENGIQEYENIPATKGVRLSTALNQALQRRNLSFSRITIVDNYHNSSSTAAATTTTTTSTHLETGPSSLASSLDENTDVENLAGHHLIITDVKTINKTNSLATRQRPQRLLSSASTDEASESNITGKQLKQRFSGMFGSKNVQQHQLCELLNGYAKNGVPQNNFLYNFDHPNLADAIDYLDSIHNSWTDFVKCDGMSETQMRIQTAIWELVTTEVYYIHTIQTVTNLFLACLEAVQSEGLLTDIDQKRLFSNVRDICEANIKFWTTYLYPMVAYSIATHEPLSYTYFQQGFKCFATIFKPYTIYCAEQSTCQFYCKELNRTNALFTSYLAWCESQKMCHRLRLADILVRPMQRLTKYTLLLIAIKKHMPDADTINIMDDMIHTVENFVYSVNNHLTTRQEMERLRGVMARIEAYDIIDTNNEQLEKLIKQCSVNLDLCGPMIGCPRNHVRHLFMEGDHRFKDNLGKSDVHCFLLTDMLLVCKAVARKGLGTVKVIRQPYLTDRLVVEYNQQNSSLHCVYLNEFEIAVTAFTLQCMEAKNWYDSLRRAKMIYTKLKYSVISSAGAHNNSISGDSTTPHMMGGGGGGNVGAVNTNDTLSIRKSPIHSSICSHVTSGNNSHSGSVEWNDSRNISVEFDKTNSLSSDEGLSNQGNKDKMGSANKLKININPNTTAAGGNTANTLTVQPLNNLGQSLPNLSLHQNQT